MRVVLAMLAVLLAASCAGAGTDSPPARGWVVGVALGGREFCPTPTVTGLHCHSGPRPHALVLVAGTDAQRRVRADGSGRFRVRLPAGRYAVTRGTARPVEVRVRPGRVTRVPVGGIAER